MGFAVLNTLMLNKSYKSSQGRNNTSQQILPLKLITVTMITMLLHVMTLGKLFTHTHTHTHTCASIIKQHNSVSAKGRWSSICWEGDRMSGITELMAQAGNLFYWFC